MANLVNKTLRVNLKDINKLDKTTKKIKICRDKYQNKYMSIEDVYFEKLIGSRLPQEYNEKELYLAKRLYKCIIMKVYNAKDFPINKKKEYLDEYNWENLKNAIIETVNIVKKEGLSSKNIVCGDITRIPFDNLFYDLIITTRDENDNKLIKILTTKITFATGDVKIGYQKGFKDINGNTVVTDCENSFGEPGKCYITLNFIKEFTPATGVLDETIAIYYYLGNGTFN